MGDIQKENGRRHFLAGFLGLAGGLVLISGASAVTIFRFVFGKARSNEKGTELELERLRLLAQDKELGKLEFQRQTEGEIFIARLSDLDAAKGKYFTDYQMQQALAFLDKDNLPILLSAKCTHLGCTVGSQVDDAGRILCPCHISYFNVSTGQPSAGSPAKKPLPHLSWLLKDDKGKVLARKTGGASIEGSADLHDLEKVSVYLLKDNKDT